MTHLPDDLVERVALAICIEKSGGEFDAAEAKNWWDNYPQAKEADVALARAALNAASSWLTERVEKVADPGVSSQALKSAEREPALYRVGGV